VTIHVGIIPSSPARQPVSKAFALRQVALCVATLAMLGWQHLVFSGRIGVMGWESTTTLLLGWTCALVAVARTHPRLMFAKRPEITHWALLAAVTASILLTTSPVLYLYVSTPH
jgi:hypothetical protein